MKVTLGTIGEAAKAVSEFNAETEIKIERFAKRVAEIVEEVADQLFSQADVDINPNGTTKKANVSVSYSGSGSSYVVIAEGEEVFFVEFGAGVFYNEKPSPHPRGEELGMLIGEYGYGRGNRKIWGFRENGELYLTHGTPAAMPMYKAATYVRNNIITIAREVFG